MILNLEIINLFGQLLRVIFALGMMFW